MLYLAAVTGWSPQRASSEGRSRCATFFEPLDVPVVNVEALVTDFDDNPVPGLTADDFEPATGNFWRWALSSLQGIEGRAKIESPPDIMVCTNDRSEAHS